MDILHLLAELERNAIHVSLDGNDLQLSFEQDEIQDRIIDLVRENKSQIISYLKKYGELAEFASIPKIEEAIDYPVSSSQNRLWILSQFEGGSLAYNMPFSIKLNGNYDIESLKKAIISVIGRHEILRTVFKENELGEIRQLVLSKEEFDLQIDYQDYRSYATSHSLVDAYITADAQKLFDLENGPLIRVSLLQLTNQDYIFYYNLHHIITDGWSMDVLAKDVLIYYEAYKNNNVPVIAPLRIQYKDYTVWHQQQLKTPLSKMAEAYWLKSLKGEIPLLELPSHKRRPIMKTYNGLRLQTYLPGKILQELKSFSRQQGGSLFMTLLATWKVLFYRYTNQQDIIIGSPTAGRQHPDLENQIGFYVNTLALRNQVNPAETFKTCYQRIKENVLHAFSHQAFPFDSLIEGLSLKRDTGRSAVFDIMIALQNISSKEIVEKTVLRDTDVILSLGPCYAKFDMEINCYEQGDYLSIVVDYNTDVYDRDLIEQLIRHYKQLAQNILDNADQLLKDVDYLLPAEKDELLNKFNDTAVSYPDDQTVLDLFELPLQQAPDSVALIFEDKILTYRQLHDQANQLANYLKGRYDIGSGDLVGIGLERSEWLPITILGILKTGAAYIPVDINYPQERIDYIIKDGGCKVFIDAGELEKFGSLKDTYSKSFVSIGVEPNHTAYCIYTSGSTGTPKGVLNTHAGLYNRLLWMKDYLGSTPKDVFLQKTPYTFDVSVWELLLPLIIGSTLVIATPEKHKDPVYLQDIIAEKEVTTVHFVPSMLGVFLMDADGRKCAGLSHIVCSGEELPADMVASCRNKLRGVRIHNLYGPTEASIDVTAIDLTEIDVEQQGVSIGVPVANTNIYIVNEFLQLQPVGVPGELLISGVQVAKGYLHLEDLTASRFIADPYIPGNRVYRTGDIARWLPDGTLQYLGRMDDQVKIRGNRIELGEVEKALLSFPAIEQGTITTGEVQGEKVLVAYYTSFTVIDKMALKYYLGQKLPEYMVPGYYVALDNIPLTVSGKVDRKSLPGIVEEDIIHGEYVAPRNETERKLAAIWQEVLGVEKVSITDGFFNLGGHSLKAIRLMSRYFKTFKTKLKLQDIFKNTSILDHANLIRNSNIDNYTPIPKAAPSESYPISNAQHMIWTSSQVKEGLISYNIPTIIMLGQDLDVACFEKALNALVTRHEILRTIFKEDENGDVRQWILPKEKLNLKITYRDIRQELNQEALMKKQVFDGDMFKAFDLEKFPLFRVTVFRKDDGYSAYFLVHHIITDGISNDIGIKDLWHYYEAFKNEKVPHLPDLNIQYKDYASWQQKQLTAKEYTHLKNYWVKQLSGDIPMLDLPSQKRRPPIKTHNGRYLQTYLSRQLTQKLYSFSEGHEGSLFMTLLAIWNVLLSRYASQHDIIIGAPIAVRNHPDLEEQIGCYINTLTLRNHVDNEESFTRFYERVKINTLGAYDNQMYPFDLLVKDLNIKKNVSRSNPLFDIMLMLQNYESERIKADVSESSIDAIEDLGMRLAKFDLEIGFYETQEHIMLRLKYNTDVYDRDLIEQLIRHYKQLAQNILDNADQLLKDVDYLLPAEKDELLNKFNDTAVSYPDDKTVLDLFELPLQQAPDSVALIFEDKILTYRQLHHQANQLANYLKGQYDIGSGDLVGIGLERSEWLPITILGILKTGAAYIPVDINYPQERIDYIIKDGGCKAFIDAGELEKFGSLKDTYSKSFVSIGVEPYHTAYCIYTSGSTGTPKGVLNTHAGLYNRLLWMKDYLGSTPKDVFLQKTPYTFDVSVWELLLPLTTGSTLVIATPEKHKDPVYLQDIIAEKEVTTVHFVPSMLGVFLMDADGRKCAGLSHIVCSGEELPVVMVEECKEKLPWVRLHNLYGPTEAAIDVTSIELTGVDTKADGVSIGKPVANTRIYIVDGNLNPQPVGVPGELLIEGIQVAHSYLNQPELTAAKFIDSPFNPGSRVYRTGDLVKWLPNGEIAYMGRMDDQVKIRGNRIELGEIETRIQASGYVEQVAVLVKGETSSRKYLVAYVIPKKDYSEELLYDHLKIQLPEYMLPSRVIEMAEFPLTSSGKLNRKALPTPDEEDITATTYEAPRNETEIVLAEIWKEVLELKQVGIQDNFFRIGGDSILSIRLISRVNKKFNVALTIAQLYQFNTIAGLSDQIKGNASSNEENKWIREDIRMSFDKLMNEVFEN